MRGHAVLVHVNASELVITKLDVLNEFETVRICIGMIPRQTAPQLPTDVATLDHITPVYEEFEDGEALAGATTYEELPFSTDLSEALAATLTSLCLLSRPARDQSIVLRRDSMVGIS